MDERFWSKRLNNINQTFEGSQCNAGFPFVSADCVSVLLAHGCKRRDTEWRWERNYTSKLLYLLANNTRLWARTTLELFSIFGSECGVCSPCTFRTEAVSNIKLEGIQCGLASSLAPCPFFLLLLWIRVVEYQMQARFLWGKSFSRYPPAVNISTPRKWPLLRLCARVVKTVEGGAADSAPPPPAAHSYPSNKIPSERWWNWLYSWDDVRTCNLWLHKVTDCQICIPGKHRSLTIPS